MSSSTIIAGAGDIGGRVAIALCNAGDEVISISRSVKDLPVGIRSVTADLNTGEGLIKLPQHADALVFCVAPDERTADAYQRLYVDGLQRVLTQCQFKRVLFVSSTAVYAQDAGEWIDEQSPALADTFNGSLLREAEMLCGQHELGIALRLTGIYGPGRNWMLRRAQAGEVGRTHWTNRIHVEDAVTAIVQAHASPSPGKIYCVNDDCPAQESEVLAWLRKPETSTATEISNSETSGRRVRNDLLRSTGWQPKYVSYREGYRQLLNAPGV
ncbi:MAG: NAD-dependent epimerase/dehydratase family protein [Arenimonas sp.]